MAFRSELEATRERADVAEKELASQTDRIARVSEIEAQLEDARRTIRESKPDRRRWVGSGAPAFAIGVLLGGGACLLWAQTRMSSLRDETAVTVARAAAERQAAERLAETAEGEERTVRARLDEAEAAVLRSRGRARSEVAELVGGLPGASGLVSPIALASVTQVDGDAPVRRGASCAVVPGHDPGCGADVVCDGVVLHSYGCAAEPRVRVEIRPGGATLHHLEDEWHVTLGSLPMPVLPMPPRSSPPGVASPGSAPSWAADVFERLHAGEAATGP